MSTKTEEELQAIVSRFASKYWTEGVVLVGIGTSKRGRSNISVLVLEGTSPKLPKTFEGLRVAVSTTPSQAEPLKKDVDVTYGTGCLGC